MAGRARIVELNEQLRTTFKGGRVRVIPGAYQLDARLRGRALCIMSRSVKVDPRGDRDRGRFVFAGYLFAWQIEYHARHGSGVSPDPADPDKTVRVLTLSVIDDLLIRPPSGFLILDRAALRDSPRLHKTEMNQFWSKGRI